MHARFMQLFNPDSRSTALFRPFFNSLARPKIRHERTGSCKGESYGKAEDFVRITDQSLAAVAADCWWPMLSLELRRCCLPLHGMSYFRLGSSHTYWTLCSVPTPKRACTFGYFKSRQRRGFWCLAFQSLGFRALVL